MFNIDIFGELKIWREERGLQDTVGNIEGNLAEELTELLRATTTEDKVDALCDMSLRVVQNMKSFIQRKLFTELITQL